MDLERIDISDFPLKHETFARKKELGDKLVAMRMKQRAAEAKKLRRRAWGWSSIGLVAAVAAFAVFMLRTVTISTADVEQMVTLPCGSTVTIAENSQMS